MKLILAENFLVRNELTNDEGLELREISPLRQVNIFLGANNSRKSRLLRGVFKTETNLLANEAFDSYSYETRVKKILDRIRASMGFQTSYTLHLTETKNYERLLEGEDLALIRRLGLPPRELGKDITVSSDLVNSVAVWLEGFFSKELSKEELKGQNNKTYWEFLRDIFVFIGRYKELEKKSRLGGLTLRSVLDSEGLPEEIRADFKSLASFMDECILNDLQQLTISKIYIPTLRSAVSFHKDSTSYRIKENILLQTILFNYRINERKASSIFTGMDFYERIKKARNAIKSERKNFEAFENFLSKTFFQDKGIDIVAIESESKAEQHIKIHIEGQGERNLHDLGDGIQSLLILLFPIFMSEKDAWIIIEEPELNLHPGLQRIFMSTIINDTTIREKNLRFFITSHSNHIIDIGNEVGNDVAFFLLRKQGSESEDKSIVKVVERNDLEILDQLGVTNSSVLMSNCCIWVEGITDRIYLDAYLKSYLIEVKEANFIEDQHYSFLEYSGSNLAHFNFSEELPEGLPKKINAHFIANRILLIADRDKGKEDKHKHLKDLERLKFQYIQTDGYEIENMLSPKSLVMGLQTLFPKRAEDIATLESKLDIAVYNSSEAITLGKYFSKIKKNDLLPEGFFEKGGTISSAYKRKFAEAVSANITWPTMSESARKMTKAIYDFIKKHNSH